MKYKVGDLVIVDDITASKVLVLGLITGISPNSCTRYKDYPDRWAMVYNVMMKGGEVLQRYEVGLKDISDV